VHAVTTRMDYALALSEEEAGRYRLMAELAAAQEADDWAAAGIAPGAAVADVGCGPGAVLAVLAERVGPTGPAMGVDRDPGAVHLAERAVLGFPQASAHVGDADDTGLPPGAFDVVMCRHVLAHNGGREQAIVDHAATLVRPVVRWPASVRGPQWAAREAMVEDGVATYDDLARWDAAFERREREAEAWMFVPVYVAVGRRPV